MTGMNEDPAALVPELCLLAGAVGGLLLGMFVPRHRQWLVRAVTIAALLAGLAAAAAAATQPDQAVYDASYTIDALLHTARIVVLAATLLVVDLSVNTVTGHRRERLRRRGRLGRPRPGQCPGHGQHDRRTAARHVERDG